MALVQNLNDRQRLGEKKLAKIQDSEDPTVELQNASQKTVGILIDKEKCFRKTDTT